MVTLSKQNRYQALALLGLLSFLAACEETTTKTTYTTAPPPPGSFSQTYIASLTVGEIVEMGINTATMTYTFKVLLSSYSLAGKAGSGQITAQNVDGSYILAASADGFINGGTIFAAQNGEISGYVNATFATGSGNAPVIGTSRAITSIGNLADTYNYVSFSCPVPSNGNYQASTSGCTSDYGTIRIDANNTYTRCSKQDLASTGCTAATSGTLQIAQSQGAFATTLSGVFNFTQGTSPANTAWIFCYTAANGRKVAVIDFNDPSTGGYGYGQAILTSQASVTAAEVEGSYALYNLIDGAKSTSIQGASYTSNVSSGSTTGSVNFNSPWPGMTAWSDSGGTVSGNAMISGTGVFVSQMAVAPTFYTQTNKWFEVGMKH